MVKSGRSVNLTALFLGRLRPSKRLTSTSCTYFLNNVDLHQMPHYVASDLGLHCLPMTLLRGKNANDPGKNGLS